MYDLFIFPDLTEISRKNRFVPYPEAREHGGSTSLLRTSLKFSLL